MAHYTKDQLLHRDLPEQFQGNFPSRNNVLDIPWDFILLGITIFFLLQDNN